MKKAISILILFILISCSKDDEVQVQAQVPLVTLDKISGESGTVLTLETRLTLNDYSYMGTIGEVNIDLIKVGKNVSFSIPNLTPGIYTLEGDIEEISYSFELEVLEQTAIPDVNQYLANLINQNNTDIDSYNDYTDTLITEGELDPNVVANDRVIWDNIRQQANLEFSNMTIDQKEFLAHLIEANKDWTQELGAFTNYQSFGFRVAESDCESLRIQGQEAIGEGETLTAMGIAWDYKWCQAGEFISSKVDVKLSKAATLLWEARDNTHYAHNWVMNLWGNKVNALGVEIYQIGTDEIVASSISGSHESNRNSNLVWGNGERKKVFVDVYFRSIRESDKDGVSTLSVFASTYINFINAYQDFVSHVDGALVWRPEFKVKDEVVPFNRFLSIPNWSVSNENVILINTQTIDNNWEVIFATDEESDQTFSYRISYDDGYTSVIQDFYASVTANESVQQRLDNGETPMQIYQSGELVSALYGKRYQGGLIFYLNTSDGSGLVSAEYDQSSGAE